MSNRILGSINSTPPDETTVKHVPIKESDSKEPENLRVTRWSSRACRVGSSEVAAALKQANAGDLLILSNDTVRSRNRLGKFLFALSTEETRATRRREIREANELKARLTDIVSENRGDASMVPAMAMAIKELQELQGALGPIKDDLSVLLKFSDADSSNRMFSVSVLGYDVRQISEDALTKAQLACQYQLADRTLKCKCEVPDSHTVTLTVGSDVLIEEEDSC